MLRHVWIRIKRKPLIFVAILLFTAIIALALCGLHSGNDTALEKYNDIYYKIDVRCTVTNLAGDQSDRLNIQSGTIALFTGSMDAAPAVLSDLVEDVQVKGATEIVWNGEVYTLMGITSTKVDSKLWPENGCTIFWNDGVDESVFSSTGAFCIIPQDMEKKMQKADLSADSFLFSIVASNQFETDYVGMLSVIGTYSGKNDKTIYCPWDTYVEILRSMGRYETADSLYATLRNNNNLSLLRETASQYFAEPNPNHAGLEMVGDYYLALDISDSQLSQAQTNLENSMTVNRIAAVLVLALSAVAGAFVGFLMVRSRKKEIALMRTMGTPNSRIYVSFVIEQMIFVILGTIVGGSKFLWNPMLWLVLFVGMYFSGLSAALLVMLHRNLLTTVKEDE